MFIIYLATKAGSAVGLFVQEDVDGMIGQSSLVNKVYGPSWCSWIIPGTEAA